MSSLANCSPLGHTCEVVRCVLHPVEGGRECGVTLANIAPDVGLCRCLLQHHVVPIDSGHAQGGGLG